LANLDLVLPISAIAMPPPTQIELLGLTNQELAEIIQGLGQAPYRARQLFDALYRQRVATLDEVSTLPKNLRSQLEQGYRIGLPVMEQRFVSRDGTVRYLLRFAGGHSVEAVWMPEGDGAGDEVEEDPAVGDEASGGTARRRATICLSSQAGCAVGCAFCMTALLGLERNLSAGEIVGQVLFVLNDQQVEVGRDRINLVFMGQGEPFLNYENFMRAVRLLTDGAGLSAARMTVSTSGIIPRIVDFAAEAVRPHLAISLNARAPDAHHAQMASRRAARGCAPLSASPTRAADL
jgi:23S rRNA (adenine2503-C2)-methyltransferase